jgi:hypothetical protein
VPDPPLLRVYALGSNAVRMDPRFKGGADGGGGGAPRDGGGRTGGDEGGGGANDGGGGGGALGVLETDSPFPLNAFRAACIAIDAAAA